MYYVYGFMLLVFLILLIVTVCVAIVASYFLLNAENYHWQVNTEISADSNGAAPLNAPCMEVQTSVPDQAADLLRVSLMGLRSLPCHLVRTVSPDGALAPLPTQWTAFGASASTALYVFLYSVHYFVFKTRMNGFFQTSFYFGCAAHELSPPPPPPSRMQRFPPRYVLGFLPPQRALEHPAALDVP